jgi:hypothetical protein
MQRRPWQKRLSFMDNAAGTAEVNDPGIAVSL